MSRYAVKKITQRHSSICSQCIRGRYQNVSPRRGFHGSTITYQKDDSVLSLLEERGYINQIAGDRDGLDRLLRSKKAGIYAGIDPTAPSLHLGHLLPLMVLFWMSLYGHNVVSLVGGGTARVGDPSGRLTSRANPAEGVHTSNFDAMFAQTGKLWDRVSQYAQRYGYRKSEFGEHRVLNNAEWLDKLNALDFLKVLGNGMRLGTMLGRDTVRNKMEKGDGMSFSEFTYPLLQGWDWWHMYRTMGVQVQIGGSDQYGNIIAGMDAIKYIAQNHEDQSRRLDAGGRLRDDFLPLGLTVPLLTTSSGEKFGKSAGNAVWLDRKMTSPFDLYGFLLRSADADVERYLKLFTFVPSTEITALMEEHNTDPGKRKAQHLLASEVLELVHGRDEAEKTRAEHQAMRDSTLATKVDGASESIVLPSSQVLNTPFPKILFHAGIASSNSDGARMVAKGGVYVASKMPVGSSVELSFRQVTDQKPENVESLLLDGRLILRIGKWKVRVIEIAT